MQNENGPCPLLALANVLLLRGGIEIHPDYPEVAFEASPACTRSRTHTHTHTHTHTTCSAPPQDLSARLAEHMLDKSAALSESDEELRANQQQNIADGMSLFPKLARGLDVNVGFTGIDAFEYSEDQVQLTPALTPTPTRPNPSPHPKFPRSPWPSPGPPPPAAAPA